MYKTTKCRRTYSLTNKIKSAVMLLMLFVSFGSYAQYCEVSTDWSSDYLSSITISNALQNISYTATSQPTGSYADQTDQVIMQSQGLSFDISTTFVGGPNGVNVWIDFDGDEEFDDSEKVFSENGANDHSGTINIPIVVAIGEYRMRVRGQYGSAANPPPCGSVSYGSTVDFTLSVIEAPDCMPPTGINAVEVTDSTAEIEWAAPTGQDTWFVYITDFGNPAPDDTTTDYEIATSSPYTIDDLDSSTQYDIYVKSDCGTDGQSFWTGPLSIYTTQVPAQMPFEEDFEGTIEWTINNGTQTNQWVVGDAVGNDDNSLYISNDQGDTHAYTITSTTVAHAFRDIQIPTDSESILLSFDWMAQAESCCDYIRVWVVPADFIPTPGTQISVANSGGVQFGGNFNQQNAWTNQFYEIPSTDYAGEIVRLVFEWRNDVSVGTQPPGAIDNVEVSEITCPTPTNLDVDGVTLESADLSWTSEGDLFDIEWGEAGFELGGSDANLEEGIETNTHTLENLDAETGYEYYVRRDCEVDGVSSWAGPFYFFTGYCEPTSNYTGDVITSFSTSGAILNINNETGSTISPGGYGDFTSMVVAHFETGEIEFTIANSAGMGVNIWVDWNNNLLFEESEKVYASASTGNGFTDSFTIPAGTPLGDYRMRVRAQWNNSNPDPCGNISWGETEDYTLTVIDPPACMPPTALGAEASSMTEADLSWTSDGDLFDIEWGEAGFDQGDGTIVTDIDETTYNLDNLTPDTEYEFYVRQDCGADGESLWAGPYLFFTGYCEVSTSNTGDYISAFSTENAFTNVTYAATSQPSGSYSNETTPPITQSAGLTFDFSSTYVGGSNGVNIWIDYNNDLEFEESEKVFSLANANATKTGAITIPVDTPVGEYRMRVRAQWGSTVNPPACGNVNYGSTLDFTLNVVEPPACMPPTELNIVQITDSTVEVGWTAPSSQDTWQILVLPSESDAPDETTTGYVEVNENPYTVEGLDPTTEYVFYVRADCGADDGLSLWTGISFITGCTTFNIPFWEGFNSDSTTEQCWTVLDENGDGDEWDMNYTSNPYEGNQVAALYTDYNNGNNNDWLITPHVDLTNDLGAALIKFHYRAQSSSEPNDYRVMLSTTGMNPDDFTLELMPLTVVSNTTYEEKIIYLLDEDGNPIQGEVYIAFHVPSGGLDGWRLYIDNVFIQPYNVDCPDPTDIEINVTCDSPPSASITWTAGTTGISWEYAVTLEGDPEPTEGTVVEENFVEIHDLEPNQDYVFWIKSNCGEAGETIWISTPFSSNASPVSQAQPFCAEEGGGIVFENGTNTGNVYGSLACLGTTPNPVWYYLQIDQPGDLDFQIIQNTAFDANGNPTGAGLDVDYIAWGPFDSMSDACMQIDLEVPTQNMLSCSYSAAAIENFSIPNAQPGEIYVLLLTNFSNNPGFIKLHQTNLDDGDSGNTDCSFLCEVDLGDDITVCAGVEVILEGEVASAGNTTDITETRWYFEDQLIDPDSYSEDGLSITVTQSGTYRLEVEKEMCTEEVVFDEIEVLFIPAYAGQIPPTIELCDELNDGVEVFNLGQYKNGLNLGDYDIELYASMDDLNSGINPLPDLYESGNTVIYAKISSSILASCSSVQEIELILIPLETPVVEFSYDDILCYDNLNSAVPYYEEGFTFGGTFSSSAGLFIDSQTGEIDVESSISGTYEVLYDYKVAPGNCGEDDSFTTTVTISEPILFEMVSYCNGGETIIDATNLRVSIPLESYNLIWIGADKVSENTAVARNTGTVTLRVEDEYGCWKEFYIEIDNTSCLITKGISPNGDGLNDYFDLSNYWVLDLKIFNRDGREVYSHGIGYTNEWEGQSNNGNPLPDGTYYYRIVTNVEEFTGWIQLVRETR